VKKISLSLLVVIALASVLWLPNLFTKGMFMDGVYHALLAHNLYHGVGSFWAPQTADYAHPAYWDNPQLSEFFLAQWYRMFGDFYWVEKLYSLFCAAIQLILIAAAWRIYFSDKQEIKKYAWLPCLLFLIIPLTSWGYSSNLMENAMSIFTTSSVIVFFLFLRRNQNLFACSVIGGALIFLALITKGPVALFSLATPFFFIWTEEKFKWQKSFAYMFLQFTTVALIFFLVFSMEAPKNFLNHYLDVQLLRAVKPEAGKSVLHFQIILQLLVALSPLLLLSVISAFLKEKDSTSNKQFLQTSVVFILIGLSASVPVMLSAKQNKHYLIPSLPLFAIGFSCLILPFVVWVRQKISATEKIEFTAKRICLFIISACIALSAQNAGTYSRDEELLSDIEKIQFLVKDEKVICADWSLYGDWALRANMNRLYDKKICMPDEVAETNFYLTQLNGRGDKLSPTAQKIFSGNKFDLYQIQ